MDNTYESSMNQAQNGARNLKEDIAERAARLKDSASGEFRNLIDDVEDLISRVADVKDPEIARIRDKVKAAVSTTREALNDGADKVRRSAQQMAGGTDDYVRENPWQALGIAALVGIAIGFLASSRRS